MVLNSLSFSLSKIFLKCSCLIIFCIELLVEYQNTSEEMRLGDSPRAPSLVVTVCRTRGMCPARSGCALRVQLGLDLCPYVTVGPIRVLKYGGWRLQRPIFWREYEQFFFIQQRPQTKKIQLLGPALTKRLTVLFICTFNSFFTGGLFRPASLLGKSYTISGNPASKEEGFTMTQ